MVASVQFPGIGQVGLVAGARSAPEGHRQHEAASWGSGISIRGTPSFLQNDATKNKVVMKLGQKDQHIYCLCR